MNERPGADPRIELSTTRVGGGRSARLVAVAALAVLVGVVGIGLVGRLSERPRPSSDQLSADASPTPTPNGPSAGIAPWQIRTMGQIRLRPAKPAGSDAFGVVASVGGRGYSALLDEIEPGHYHAMYVVPFPRPATEGTLALNQLWSRAPGQNYVPIGSWYLSLDPLAPETRNTADVIDVSVAGRHTMTTGSRLQLRGYRLRVRAESRLNSGVLWVDVWLGPGREIHGDDGIFGWPTVAQIQALQPRRGPGMYNRCRWDIGPQAANPRIAAEAECG